MRRYLRVACPIIRLVEAGRGDGMTVVYVDSVFFLNGAMDFVLFLVTARLAGIPLKRHRYLLAALLGAIYAVTVFLPNMQFLSAFPAKLAVGFLMALVAFGGEDKLLRLILLLFAVSCAMAGCVLALGLLSGSRVPVSNGIFYTDINTKILLIAAAAAYLVLTIVFRTAAYHGVGGDLLQATLCIAGKIGKLTVLHDSGNSLRDPSGADAVLVAAPGSLDMVLPKEIQKLLSPELLRYPADLLEPLRTAEPSLRPQLLPYRAVGVPSGLLLTIRADWLEICGSRHKGVRVALSPSTLGAGYAALWGGAVEKGGRRNGFKRKTAEVSDMGGIDAAGGRSLYRRQRHSPSASDKGEGIGAFKAHRR